MSTKDKYLEAIQRADAKDAARAAKKDRAQKRATLRAQASAPAQASVQSSPSLQSDQDVLASVPATAPQEEESQTKKMCLCHKEQNRLMDSHGCCKATIDAIRFSSRMPADVDLDDVARVQALVDSGIIKRAKTKGELAAQRESRGTASALKEVANAPAGGKPVVIQPKADLPEGVNFFDVNQARHLAKCILLRGMNFAAGVSDAYPKLSAYEAGVVAEAAQRDANIRAALEQEASQRGLGDSDKQVYVSLLWKHALSQRPQDYQDRGTAMRILGRVFLPENGAQQKQPTVLQIEGFSEGIARMFPNGELEKHQSQPVTMPDLSESDFGAEDGE